MLLFSLLLLGCDEKTVPKQSYRIYGGAAKEATTELLAVATSPQKSLDVFVKIKHGATLEIQFLAVSTKRSYITRRDMSVCAFQTLNFIHVS